jgi:hypothetical protein
MREVGGGPTTRSLPVPFALNGQSVRPSLPAEAVGHVEVADGRHLVIPHSPKHRTGRGRCPQRSLTSAGDINGPCSWVQAGTTAGVGR